MGTVFVIFPCFIQAIRRFNSISTWFFFQQYPPAILNPWPIYSYACHGFSCVSLRLTNSYATFWVFSLLCIIYFFYRKFQPYIFIPIPWKCMLFNIYFKTVLINFEIVSPSHSSLYFLWEEHIDVHIVLANYESFQEEFFGFTTPLDFTVCLHSPLILNKSIEKI